MPEFNAASPADTLDETFMRIALQAARLGEGSVEPNPMVGCVIVRDGELIGKGHHEKFGEPHAEVMALRSLTSIDDARGATAYVTLEPCCHHGKTPPCVDALIDAGIARVVVAMQDPFAKVDGGGLRRLVESSIETSVGVLAQEAAEIVAPFVKQVRTGVPWVIAKWAMTIDGKIATTTGESQWITGDESRREVHRLRGRVDAVVAGMGTVIADDPMLTARPPGPRSQTRVVLCRNRLPSLTSKLVQSAGAAPVWLLASSLVHAQRTECLADRGVRVIRLPTSDRIEMIHQSMDLLGGELITNVMIEGGGELLSSFVESGHIDECHVYVGSKLFGGKFAPGPIGGLGVSALKDASEWALRSLDRFGNDARMIYRRRA